MSLYASNFVTYAVVDTIIDEKQQNLQIFILLRSRTVTEK